MKKYQEFQKACKIAWESQGMQEKETHKILKFLATNFGMERSQKMIAEAWKIYRPNNQKNKYLLNTTRGTQCSVVAKNTKEAYEIAVSNDWTPKNELPLLAQENV